MTDLSKKEYARMYYEKNKEKAKQYYQDNKERLLEQSKEYYKNNKDKCLDYQKAYQEKNKQKPNRKRYRERELTFYNEKIKPYLSLKTIEGIQRRLAQLKARSIQRGFEFNLTEEDFMNLPTHCPVLGIELKYEETSVNNPNNPTVDRIDSSKGYIKGNIMIISHRANSLKNNATFDEIRLIYEFYSKNCCF